MENNLTINEKNELETLEGIIGREMGSFMAVGNALLTIRNSKLYREEFQSFNDYCNFRWGMGRHNAHHLMRGSQVATNLLTTGQQLCTPCEIQPTSERQIRPLTPLEPEQQREVWGEAVKTFARPGKVPTYEHVRATVTALIGPAPPPPPKKEDPHRESDAEYFTTIAISQLRRIRDDDTRRVEMLERVIKWCNENLTHLKKKGK